MIPPALEAQAQKWLDIDRDDETRKVISDLLAADDAVGLDKRLSGRIGFGTAGLRAEMDAGFTRMNCVTVLQTSKGLASYLLDTDETRSRDGDAVTVASGVDGRTPPPPSPTFRPFPAATESAQVPVTQRGVVIGRDARRNSERFAILAAIAFISRGFRVWWFPDPIHTPLVPFAVRYLGAAAGVMVTASHNPKDDNGYKVYWGNGCQIISPHDAGIADQIERVVSLGEALEWEDDVPGGKARDAHALVDHAYVTRCDDLVTGPYVKRVGTLAPVDKELLRPLRFVYTPMHGTGLGIMETVLKAIGLGPDQMVVVPEQAKPDPTFPTVRFPNPEEKGALNLAIATADRHDIDLILASDPDADRLAVAQRIKNADGSARWHQFTGNEVGVLLAAHVLEVTPSPESSVALLASAVSSQMMAKMAAEAGVTYRETLTGFKWIGNTALSLLDGGSVKFAFGYEEALGYMFSSIVPDKDSISAAVAFLHAIGRWKSRADENKGDDATGAPTAYDKLVKLRKRYGYFAEANTYLKSPSPAATAAAFASIRRLGLVSSPGTDCPASVSQTDVDAADPSVRGCYPSHVGSYKLVRWCDLTLGYDSAAPGPDHTPVLPTSRDAEMISCELASSDKVEDENETRSGSGSGSDVRFTIRASGTEPKIKIYVEARSAASMDEAQRVADETQASLIRDWFGGADAWC